MRIIGVDPGLATTGYGIIDAPGPPGGRRRTAVEGGVVKTRPRDPLERRLTAVYRDMWEVLGEFSPAVMAVEDLHTRYRNLKTAIIMGHARGVVCLAAGEFGIPVFSYQPAQAKNLVTGSGRADKEQVRRAVAAHLDLPGDIASEHVADAFSIALCHAMISESPLSRVG